MGNGSDLITFGIALVVFAITLIVAKLGRSFMRYNDRTRAIAANMRHARDQQEYLYWRRELLWHYLHLIPCMTETGMNKLCTVFRKGRHHDGTRRSDGLVHILAPSVAGLCICALTLCGVSYAWFTATVSSSTGTIKAAQYGVNVTIANKADTAVDITTDRVGIVTAALAQGNTYTVTMTATGTATNGYCSVILKDTASTYAQTYYTERFVPNSTMTFTVDANKVYTLTITPQWGSCAIKEGEHSLKNKDTIGTSAGRENTTEQADGKTPDGARTSGDGDSNAAPANSDTPKNDGAVSTPKTDDTHQSSGTSSPEVGTAENVADGDGTVESSEPSAPESDISSPAVTDPQQRN